MMEKYTCMNFEKQINHYLDGELDGSVLELFNNHLKHCSSCFRLLQEYQTLDKILKESPQVEVPLKLKYRILQNLKATQEKKVWWLYPGIRVGILVATILLIAIGLRQILPKADEVVVMLNEPPQVEERSSIKTTSLQEPTLAVLSVADLSKVTEELDKYIADSTDIILQSRESGEAKVLYYIIVPESTKNKVQEFIAGLEAKPLALDSVGLRDQSSMAGIIYIYLTEEKK